jgi:hypothetical protein
MSNTAYDVLRAQIQLQQCAIDALIATHPDREQLARIFSLQSAEFLQLIEEKGFEPDAVAVTKQMRQAMLRRMGRTEH